MDQWILLESGDRKGVRQPDDEDAMLEDVSLALQSTNENFNQPGVSNSQTPIPLERGDTIPATPPPPSPKLPRPLADILAEQGFRVRDFAYEDTGLPPIPSYKPPPRFVNQPLRHPRHDFGDTHRIRSQPLQRGPTEPDLDPGPSSQHGGLTREMGFMDFADYQPASQGGWSEQLYSQSQSQPVSQPLPALVPSTPGATSQSHNEHVAQVSQDSEWVATPFVTPNGSYVWPGDPSFTAALDASAIGSSLADLIERGRTLSRTSLGSQSAQLLASEAASVKKSPNISSLTAPLSFHRTSPDLYRSSTPSPTRVEQIHGLQSPHTRSTRSRKASPRSPIPQSSRGSHFLRQSISHSPRPALEEEEPELGTGRYHLRKRRGSPPYPPPATSTAARSANTRKRTSRSRARERESGREAQSRRGQVRRGEAMVMG